MIASRIHQHHVCFIVGIEPNTAPNMSELCELDETLVSIRLDVWVSSSGFGVVDGTCRCPIISECMLRNLNMFLCRCNDAINLLKLIV